MHPVEPGGLRWIADALFRALDRLGPDVHPAGLDLTSCDALTHETDVAHLILQGKMCVQRLYKMGTRPEGYERDSAFILTCTVDLVVREINDVWPTDSDDLHRLNDAWHRLQVLRMELERLYTADDP